MNQARGIDAPIAGTDEAVAQPSVKTHWVLLPLFVLVTLTVYYPFARHNLPVAANVDDRTSLSVLRRFAEGSANPKFFMYPTLYYYLTYAVTAPFGFAKILFTGRLLNLGFVGLTAFLSYLFCLKNFKSAGAGMVAACCVIASPTLISSGAYLCTDVLLAALTMLSLHLLIGYFQSGSSRAWLYAMLAVGGAIATKYTAGILFVTYCLVEVVHSYRQTRLNEEGVQSTRARFSETTITVALVSASVVALLAAIFFPVQTILHFVAVHRTNVEARSLQDYLMFLSRLRRLLVELAAAAVILLVAVKRSRLVYESISTKRLYFGLLIVLAVFFITTPYSVLDPGKFIYDIGALLRSNVVVKGSQQQWGNYWHWLFDTERRVPVIAGLIGLGLMAYRAPWRYLTASVYVLVYVVTICSSHLGVRRYLDPLLPLLYCGAGLTALEIWRGRPRIPVLIWKGLVCLAGVIVLIQIARETETDVKAASEQDAFYSSYEEVLKVGAKGTVYYAGFAPSVELELAGFRTKAISWQELGGGTLGAQLSCDDLLILNERVPGVNQVSVSQDQTVELLLDDPRGQGQMVLGRKGCR